MKTMSPRVLDRRGKTITTYVVFDAAVQLETMDEGDRLEIWTDDFEPFRWDLAAWCEAAGHRLVERETTPKGYRFLVEKGPPTVRTSSLAMVISVAGLEELLSPLGFALAAAMDGVDVHLYFQGPAVRVLARGFRPKLSGWARPFSRFAASAMAKSGHVAPEQKLRQLHHLGAHLYACGGSMQHFKVVKEELLFDDIPVVEYFSFMAVMEHADVQMYI